MRPLPFRWIIAGSQFRYENGRKGEFSAMLSGHGKPIMSSPGETHMLTYETAELQKPFHLPGLVLRSILNDENYQIELIKDKSTSTATTMHIRVTQRLFNILQRGTRQDWWIDSSTLLPVKVTFMTPGQAVESYMGVTDSFSGWSTHGANGAGMDLSSLTAPALLLFSKTRMLWDSAQRHVYSPRKAMFV